MIYVLYYLLKMFMYHPKYEGNVSKNMYWEGDVYHLCVRLYINTPNLQCKAHSSFFALKWCSQNSLCSFFELEFDLNQTIHSFFDQWLKYHLNQYTVFVTALTTW